MNDLQRFCNNNRIHLDGPDWNRGPRRNRPNQSSGGYRDDDFDPRDQGRGNRARTTGQQNQGQGKGRGSNEQSKQTRKDEPKPQPKGKKGQEPKQKEEKKTTQKDNQDKPQKAQEKTQKAAAKDKEKEATSATAATPIAAKESVYWRYGPFPPNSRAARRTKSKVKLGSRGLKKLAALDGKKWEKNGPIYQSSLEVLAKVLSFLNALERWKLRSVSAAFALAFQLDPAWTTATLEPSNSFAGPWIRRDHLPTQLDVMHKHRDVLETLIISGFDGLQGALLQNFTALVTLKAYSCRGCYGLACIPKSVKQLHLEFCHFKGEASAELDALKESHPEIEAVLVKCMDEKKPEGEGEADKDKEKEKAKLSFINARLAGGKVQ